MMEVITRAPFKNKIPDFFFSGNNLQVAGGSAAMERLNW
jgi:hypothetical protein